MKKGKISISESFAIVCVWAKFMAFWERLSSITNQISVSGNDLLAHAHYALRGNVCEIERYRETFALGTNHVVDYGYRPIEHIRREAVRSVFSFSQRSKCLCKLVNLRGGAFVVFSAWKYRGQLHEGMNVTIVAWLTAGQLAEVLTVTITKFTKSAVWKYSEQLHERMNATILACLTDGQLVEVLTLVIIKYTKWGH